MSKNKLPKPITLLILTLLTVIVWVGLTIYRTITIKPAPDVPQNISEPLVPTLDTNTIQNIESSIFIPDSELPVLDIKQNQVAVNGSVATPVPTTTPESTTSAEIVQ